MFVITINFILYSCRCSHKLICAITFSIQKELPSCFCHGITLQCHGCVVVSAFLNEMQVCAYTDLRRNMTHCRIEFLKTEIAKKKKENTFLGQALPVLPITSIVKSYFKMAS